MWKRFLSVGKGDKVFVHLEGKLKCGKVFDPRKSNDPALTFIMGNGEMMPSIEQNLIGMNNGERKSFIVPAENAFGMHEAKRVIKIQKKQMGMSEEEENALVVGQRLGLKSGHTVLVKELTEENVVLDTNHELAGEELHFDVELESHVKESELSDMDRPVMPVDEIQPGDGVNFPKRGDELVMHYVGTLKENGSQFDSSRDRNEPFKFRIGVGQVIQGWEEGVTRMSKGQRAILKVPANKGYGKRGAGETIPPDADLVFDVELIDIL